MCKVRTLYLYCTVLHQNIHTMKLGNNDFSFTSLMVALVAWSSLDIFPLNVMRKRPAHMIYLSYVPGARQPVWCNNEVTTHFYLSRSSYTSWITVVFVCLECCLSVMKWAGRRNRSGTLRRRSWMDNRVKVMKMVQVHKPMYFIYNWSILKPFGVFAFTSFLS